MFVKIANNINGNENVKIICLCNWIINPNRLEIHVVAYMVYKTIDMNI